MCFLLFPFYQKSFFLLSIFVTRVVWLVLFTTTNASKIHYSTFFSTFRYSQTYPFTFIIVPFYKGKHCNWPHTSGFNLSIPLTFLKNMIFWSHVQYLSPLNWNFPVTYMVFITTKTRFNGHIYDTCDQKITDTQVMYLYI